MVWLPFGPHGLFSNPDEWHATILGIVVALAILALYHRGRRKTAFSVLAGATLAILVVRDVSLKPWYYAWPMAVLAAGYIALRRYRA